MKSSTKPLTIDAPCPHHIFAAMVGVSPPTISRFVGTTLPRGGAVKDWVLAWCKHLEDKGTRHAGHRNRLVAAQADSAELDLAEARGQVVNRERAAAEYAALVVKAQRRLRQVPKMAAPRVASMKTPQAEELLEQLIDEALAELTPKPNGR